MSIVSAATSAHEIFRNAVGAGVAEAEAPDGTSVSTWHCAVSKGARGTPFRPVVQTLHSDATSSELHFGAASIGEHNAIIEAIVEVSRPSKVEDWQLFKHDKLQLSRVPGDVCSRLDLWTNFG
jgi:hypothetical protein